MTDGAWPPERLPLPSSTERRAGHFHRPDGGFLLKICMGRYAMTEEKKALIARSEARLKAAILPTQGSGRAHHCSPPPIVIKPPNWDYWRHMPTVARWEACALALNIEPDSVDYRAGSLYGQPETWHGFPSDEIREHFFKLLRLLDANQFEKQHFTQNLAKSVSLSEFAAWCAPVVRDLIGCDIPPELAALAKAASPAPKMEDVLAAPPSDDAPADAPAAEGKVGTGATPGGDNVEEEAPAADDHDKTLAALFDSVPVEALEKMFPASGKWKSWAEKAASNGLKIARTERARFNPYKAGVWFVRKGAEG